MWLFERWLWNVWDINGVFFLIEMGLLIDKWLVIMYGIGGSLNGCLGWCGC